MTFQSALVDNQIGRDAHEDFLAQEHLRELFGFCGGHFQFRASGFQGGRREFRVGELFFEGGSGLGFFAAQLDGAIRPMDFVAGDGERAGRFEIVEDKVEKRGAGFP